MQRAPLFVCFVPADPDGCPAREKGGASYRGIVIF